MDRRGLLAVLALAGNVTFGAGSASAQDKTIKIGGLFPMSGPGAYFGAQDKQGIELALEELNKTGVNGYNFAIEYENFRLLSPARLAGRQAPARSVQAGRDHRRGVLRRHPRHHADRRRGQGAADQCRLLVDPDHRSGGNPYTSESCRTR